MARIPFLFKRKNVFYFRIRIPVEYQELLKVREIVQSLKTEKQAEAIPLALQLAAHYKASLQNLKHGKTVHQFIRLNFQPNTEMFQVKEISVTTQTKSTAPLLSVVIDDFLKRYDPANKAMLGKLTGTLD